MSVRVVMTGSCCAQDVRDEFYFSSPQKYGGGAELGDQVKVVSAVTGNVLALGEVVEKGSPYDECRTVKVVQRFA